MKKTALVLTLCVLLMLCSVVFAENQGTFYEKYGIWVDKETGTVTGFADGITQLSIPSKIDGVTITGIGDSAFLSCDTLEKLTLPKTIKKIGDLALADCSMLKELVLPAGITEIGTEAFAQCTALETVTLPSSLKKLGNHCFIGCSSLTEINISGQNSYFTSIDGILFSHDQSVLIQYPAGKQASEYAVPETVTSIAGGAFSYSSALTKISLSDNLNSIGDFAFFNCDVLTEIVVPNSVTYLGKEAFGWCDALQKATLSNQLKTIEYGVFWFSRNLKEVNIPDSVTTISDYAFARCESLASIRFPENVVSLGEESFAFCYRLKEIIFPENLTMVGNRAFCDSALVRVTIKNGDLSFGEDVFKGCNKLLFFVPRNSLAQQYAEDCGYEWEKIVTVTYQGHPIQFDQLPVTRANRTLVPVRAIVETMGAEVFWEEASKTVTAVRGDRTIIMQINQPMMTVNGESISLDVAPQQIGGRTLVPVRAIADGLMADIYWEEDTQTVSIWEREN